MVMPTPPYEGEPNDGLPADDAESSAEQERQQRQTAPPSPSLTERALLSELQAARNELAYIRRRQETQDREGVPLSAKDRQAIQHATARIDALDEARRLETMTDDERANYYRTQRDEVREQRRQQEETPAAVTTPPSPEVSSDWTTEHVPDLQNYARRLGFTDAEMAAPNWMDRLYAAGMPHRDYPDTPAGRRALKDALYAAMDAEAQRQHAASRPQTRTPGVVSAGTSGVRDITSYQEALKRGGPLPSPAEIDRMTARYLNE